MIIAMHPTGEGVFNPKIILGLDWSSRISHFSKDPSPGGVNHVFFASHFFLIILRRFEGGREELGY